MISEALDKISKAKNEYDELVRNAAGSIQDAIIEAFKELPEDVVLFQWAQYTPYFNDGEACVFRANSPTIATKHWLKNSDFETVEQAEEEYSLWDFHELYSWRHKDDSEDAKEVGLSVEDYKRTMELGNFITSCDDLMLAAFGDHALVRIRREENGIKFSVDEYDHD